MVSSRLRDRRYALGLTQNHVVTRLEALGVRTTNRSLSGLEHGVGIGGCRLPELAAALDCTVTYLLGLTEDPSRWLPDGLAAVALAQRREPWRRDGLARVPVESSEPEAQAGEARPAEEGPDPVGRILGERVPDR